MRAARAVLGFVLGVVARLWLSTLRLKLEVHPSLELPVNRDRPWVLAFFHGKQWPLLAWRRRRPTVVMVSHSKDGEIQSLALSVLGLTIVRGSSSRGGARGLAALVRLLRKGDHDAAFAVDGPRGPYGVPKPGVLLAARSAGAVIVPFGSAIARGTVFGRAWDRFALAWPFTTVSLVLGPPFEPGETEEADAHIGPLTAAIEAANTGAQGFLAVAADPMLPFPKHLPLLSPANGNEGPTKRRDDCGAGSV